MPWAARLEQEGEPERKAVIGEACLGRASAPRGQRLLPQQRRLRSNVLATLAVLQSCRRQQGVCAPSSTACAANRHTLKRTSQRRAASLAALACIAQRPPAQQRSISYQRKQAGPQHFSTGSSRPSHMHWPAIPMRSAVSLAGVIHEPGKPLVLLRSLASRSSWPALPAGCAAADGKHRLHRGDGIT